MEFRKTELGFWRQVKPEPFKYTEEYKARQGTDDFMAYMRIGFLGAYFGHKLSSMIVVDVGCGNGSFVKAGERAFKQSAGYDIVGKSISRSELLSTPWDIAVFTDTLEHMPKLEFLFQVKWKYALISYPETPQVDRWEELQRWRHFKPDEHIWCLNYHGIRKWLRKNGCRIIKASDFEDILRPRWQVDHRNVTSILCERRKDKKL